MSRKKPKAKKRYKNSQISQDEYNTLPDSELKEQFRFDRKVQRLIAVPLIALLYFAFILAQNLIFGGVAEASVGAAAVFAVIGYSFVFVSDPDDHIKAVKVDVFAMSVLTIPCILEKSGWRIIAIFFFIFIVIAGNTLAHPVIRDLALLRAHPRYPFDNWRRDESYLSRTDVHGAIRYIDNTLNTGKAVPVAGEEFLEGDLSEFKAPEYDPSDDFQQRKQIWRGHDKDDTGYTLDNIRNMYFDKPDEGELSGKELERELMKATAPKKAAGPLPEDFFQQTPIIWRADKHDNGTTAPQGKEKKERSVLM